MISTLKTSGRRFGALFLMTLLIAIGPIAAFAGAEDTGKRHEEPVERKAEAGSEESESEPGSGIVPRTITQEQNPITQPLALSPDVTRKRVGIDENLTVTLALRDAIAMALQNNLDIELSRQGVQIAQYNLFGARGVYDVTSSSEMNYSSRTFPVASIFAGGDEGSAITNKQFSYNFGTGQLVEKGGGNWQVDFTNSRLNTTNTSATLTTQYNSNLTLAYTQPLMRNLSIDQNRRQIRLAQKQLDLTDSQFRERVIQIISSVQSAYWDLVFAIRNEIISRESVELTKVQLSNNQKMVEAGTLAPIELRSTEAALEARKEQVIVALQNITFAENVLKGLLSNDPNDNLWNSAIVPADEPDHAQVGLSLADSIRLALSNRPELEQMRLQTQQNEIDVRFFENQTKPQIDLFTVYSNVGLAGNPSETLGRSVPDRFQGGYFQTLRNVFGQDFRTWQAGVRISFPWRNRTAEANLGRAMAETRQLDARQRQLVQGIQIEVRNALQAVEAARQRYEAARAGRIAAEAQLRGEEERFLAGLQTNFFVLQRQNELAIARGDEVRALTDYNKALAELQRVTGTTLTNNNVEVTSVTTEIKY